MKKIALDQRDDISLLVDGNVAVLSCDAKRRNMAIIRDLQENTDIQIPCACEDCIPYDLQLRISRTCIENAVSTLILGHKTTWYPFEGLRVIEASHTSYPENTLPSRFQVVASQVS